MAVIRSQKLVPEVYVNGSRDFELLCNLYDVALNSSKLFIDGMQYVTDTNNINADLLNLLATKIGFESKKTFNDDELRYILASLPYLIRGKGSLGAVKKLIDMCLKLYNVNANTEVFVTKQATVVGKLTLDAHTLVVGIESIMGSSDLIREVGRYILPTGFTLYIYYYQGMALSQYVQYQDHIEMLYCSDNIGSQVRRWKNADLGGLHLDFGLDTTGDLPEYSIKYTDDHGDVQNELLYDNLIGTVGTAMVYTPSISKGEDTKNKFLGVYNDDLPPTAKNGQLCIFQTLDTNLAKEYTDINTSLDKYWTYHCYEWEDGTGWRLLDFIGVFDNLSVINTSKLNRAFIYEYGNLKQSRQSKSVVALEHKKLFIHDGSSTGQWVETSDDSGSKYRWKGVYLALPTTMQNGDIIQVSTSGIYYIAVNGAWKEAFFRGEYVSEREAKTTEVLPYAVWNETESKYAQFVKTKQEALDWIQERADMGDPNTYVVRPSTDGEKGYNVVTIYGLSYYTYEVDKQGKGVFKPYNDSMFYLKSKLVKGTQ